MRIRKILSLFVLSTVLFALPILVFCARGSNPFTDPANSKAAVVSFSLSGRDTVMLYSADTLIIGLAVETLLDSFSVEIPKNRYFQDTSVVILGRQGDDVYSFLVSFYDTGLQTIDIKSYRGGKSEEAIETFRFHVVSPLLQSDLGNRIFGETVHLSTPGVTSTNIRYHWDFGSGVIINSPVPDTSLQIVDAGFSDSGYLWVSTISGEFPSPRTFFRFSFNDNQGPTIVCINEGYIDRDTVMTGASRFSLMMHISDRGGSAARIAWADGVKIDEQQNRIYVIPQEGMELQTGLRSVNIKAEDDHGNESTDTIYVGYDKTLIKPGEGISLELRLPAADSAFQSVPQAYLFGVLWNYTGDSVSAEIFFNVNGVPSGTPYTISGKSIYNEWSGSVLLETGLNRVSVAAIAKSGDTIGDTAINLIYDTSKPDTISPAIVEITADGIDADRQYTTRDTVLIRIVVFDQGSGFNTVTLNNSKMLPIAGGGNYIWGKSVSLKHLRDGNLLRIKAVDNNGNVFDSSVTMFYNNPPEVRIEPAHPVLIFPGSRYTDRITTSDKDGDEVIIEKKSTLPTSLTVSAEGEIEWTPTIDDTGTHTVKISLFDRYQYLYYYLTITVSDTVDFSSPSFITSEENFPAFLEAGKDTLNIELTAIRGRPPYTFKAIPDGERSVPHISDNILTWAPDSGDTGLCRLTITASDSFNYADTLVPVILITDANNPCSLSVSSGVDTLPGGILDFSDCVSPETLSITIHDPDNPVSEKHVLTLNSGQMSVTGVQESCEGFRIVIDPEFISGRMDTLSVTVTDKAGHQYSLDILMAKLVWTININTLAAGISGNVYNYPLLVRLSGENFRQSAPFFKNLSFRKSRGGSVYPFEIERWDTTAETAEIWVRIDTIVNGASSQKFEMFVNSAITSSASNGAAVFDTAKGFDGVWHMNENPESGTGAIQDRTKNTNHMTPNGSMTSADAVIGTIGKAVDFDGINDYAICPSPAAAMKFIDTLTISAWVNIREHSAPDYAGILTRPFNNGTSESWAIFMIKANKPAFSAGASSETPLSASAAGTGSWYHITGRKQYNVNELFVNGVLVSLTNSSRISVSNDDNEVIIGGNANGGTLVSDFFNGIIDEVRASGTARSLSWIKLDYETQKPSSTIVTVE